MFGGVRVSVEVSQWERAIALASPLGDKSGTGMMSARYVTY